MALRGRVMSEPDMIDVGSRVLFKGRPGTIVDASPELSPGPGWWIIVLDTGERVAPTECHPDLHPWSPATPSERMLAWRRQFARKVLEDVRERRLHIDQADRVLDLLVLS